MPSYPVSQEEKNDDLEEIALGGMRERAQAHEKLGVACYNNGAFNESLRHNLHALLERNDLTHRCEELRNRLADRKRVLELSWNHYEALKLNGKVLALNRQLQDDLSTLASSHAKIGWLHYEQGEFDAAVENYRAAIAVRAKLGPSRELTALVTVKQLITDEKRRKEESRVQNAIDQAMREQAVRILLEQGGLVAVGNGDFTLNEPCHTNGLKPLMGASRTVPFRRPQDAFIKLDSEICGLLGDYKRPVSAGHGTVPIDLSETPDDYQYRHTSYSIPQAPANRMEDYKKSDLKQRIPHHHKSTKPRQKVYKARKGGSKPPRKVAIQRRKEQDKEYSKALRIGDWDYSKTFSPIQLNEDNVTLDKKQPYVLARNVNGYFQGRNRRKSSPPLEIRSPKRIEDKIWSFSMLTSKQPSPESLLSIQVTVEEQPSIVSESSVQTKEADDYETSTFNADSGGEKSVVSEENASLLLDLARGGAAAAMEESGFRTPKEAAKA